MRLVLLQMKTPKNVLRTHFDNIPAYDRLRNSPTKYCTHFHTPLATLINYPNTLLLEKRISNVLTFYIMSSSLLPAVILNQMTPFTTSTVHCLIQPPYFFQTFTLEVYRMPIWMKCRTQQWLYQRTVGLFINTVVCQ